MHKLTLFLLLGAIAGLLLAVGLSYVGALRAKILDRRQRIWVPVLIIAIAGLGATPAYLSLAGGTLTGPLAGTFIDSFHLGGIWEANRWCANIAAPDQTCFQNAINDVTVNGAIGPDGRHMGVIVASPQEYTFNSAVTVPAGTQVEIRGAGLESNWGTVLVAGSGAAQTSFFQVTADSISIDGLMFEALNKYNCITLGTSGSETFDSRIYNNWFSGCVQAIHMINYGGGHFFNNDIELGTFGIVSNKPGAGDVGAANLLIQNNRFFQENEAILLDGTGSTLTGVNPAFGIIDIVGNEIDSGGFMGDFPVVSLNNIWHINLTGNNFRYNTFDDIEITNSANVALVGNVSMNPGRNFAILNGIDGLTAAGNTLRNCNISSFGGITAGINADNLTHASIIGFTASADSGEALCEYSIYVGSSSTGTTVAGNNVIAQVIGDYDILDASAALSIPDKIQFGSATGADLSVFGKSGLNFGGDFSTQASGCAGTQYLSKQSGATPICFLDTGGLTMNAIALMPGLTGTTGSIGGGALLVNACATGTATVTGVTTAMALQVTPVADPNGATTQDYDWYGYLSSANTVTVKVCAIVAGTPAATAYNVRAIQ